MKEKIGSFLVRKGVITPAQLDTALAHQKRLGGRLGPILISLRYVTPRQFLGLLSEHFRCPPVDLSTYSIERHLIELIRPELAREAGVLPIMEKTAGGRKVLYVAMRQPDNLTALDQVSFSTDHDIQPMVALDASLTEAIEYFYQDLDASVFASFDGREQVLGFEETSPDTLDHLYPGLSASELAEESMLTGAIDVDDDMKINFSTEVDAKTYLKFLIKLLLRKGVITKDDMAGILKD